MPRADQPKGPFTDTRHTAHVENFRTLFVLFYCSAITRKPAESLYIYLAYIVILVAYRASRIGKRTFNVKHSKFRLLV